METRFLGNSSKLIRQSGKTHCHHTTIEATPQELLKTFPRVLPWSDEIVSYCGSSLYEWEHLVRVSGWVGELCVWEQMHVHNDTNPLGPCQIFGVLNPYIQATPIPHKKKKKGPIQHGVPRLTSSRDPLPVLSPFNDWISSRLPSSRVIAWWSTHHRARVGGSTWQWASVLAKE